MGMEVIGNKESGREGENGRMRNGRMKGKGFFSEVSGSGEAKLLCGETGRIDKKKMDDTLGMGNVEGGREKRKEERRKR